MRPIEVNYHHAVRSIVRVPIWEVSVECECGEWFTGRAGTARIAEDLALSQLTAHVGVRWSREHAERESGRITD